VQLAPEDPEAHYELGLALARIGRTADAVAELRTTLRLKPAHAGAHELLTRIGPGRLPGS
jgi:Flp pilus assembly protein TadD